jgi:signal transduction histidine kinase
MPHTEPSGPQTFDRRILHTTGRASPDWRPRGPGPHFVDLRLVCQALVDTVSSRADRQGVTIDLSLTESPAKVIGFAEQLYEAIEQLMTQALDAMPRGGRLIVRVDRDPYVIVECADTGPERPASASASSRTIIEAHRGYIWHRRQPGGGTCAIVELPAAAG